MNRLNELKRQTINIDIEGDDIESGNFFNCSCLIGFDHDFCGEKIFLRDPNSTHKVLHKML